MAEQRRLIKKQNVVVPTRMATRRTPAPPAIVASPMTSPPSSPRPSAPPSSQATPVRISSTCSPPEATTTLTTRRALLPGFERLVVRIVDHEMHCAGCNFCTRLRVDAPNPTVMRDRVEQIMETLCIHDKNCGAKRTCITCSQLRVIMSRDQPLQYRSSV